MFMGLKFIYPEATGFEEEDGGFCCWPMAFTEEEDEDARPFIRGTFTRGFLLGSVWALAMARVGLQPGMPFEDVGFFAPKGTGT